MKSLPTYANEELQQVDRKDDGILSVRALSALSD